MNDTLFSVTSYCGVTVTLSKDNWEKHITVHHEELSDAKDAVKDTIKDPDVVYESKHDDGSQVYFKDSDYCKRNALMSVVVSYGPGKKNPETNVGEVITAYYSKTATGKGDPVYERENNDSI